DEVPRPRQPDGVRRRRDARRVDAGGAAYASLHRGGRPDRRRRGVLDARHAQLLQARRRMIEAPANPIERFAGLFEQAKALPRAVLPEPTAFALGTVDGRGNPSVRIVLLKSLDDEGFVFYTNFESRKGRELLGAKRAALCFHWQ